MALWLALAAVVPANGAEEQKAQRLTLSIWEGAVPGALIEQFTAATGIEVDLIERPGAVDEDDGVLAGGVDVVLVSAPLAQRLAADDRLAELEHGKLPNLKHLHSMARKLKHDEGNRFSVPLTWGTTGLCYRADLVKAPPVSWGELINPADELAGKVTALPFPRWLVGAALKAGGQSLNTTDAEKLKEAVKRLNGRKKGSLGFDGSAHFVRLARGEVVVAQAWDSWCNQARRLNDKVAFALPKEGSDLWVDVLVVPKDAPNGGAAHLLIDFLLKPESAETVIAQTLQKTPNEAGMKRVDADLMARFPSLTLSPETLARQEQMLDVGKARNDYAKAARSAIDGK